jgi:hypothetical protein
MNHLISPVAFIEVGASGKDCRALARRRRDNAKSAAVTNDGRRRKARQLGQLTAAYRLTKIVGSRRPA